MDADEGAAALTRDDVISVLDRYILRSLLVNYVIALAVMLSLYVVLDMLFNLDEFTERDPSTAALIANLIDYYGPNLALYFAQLSGVIATYACLATVARLRVQNEMTALLSSGVSLYRVAVPVVAFGVFAIALQVADTELLVPSMADKLVRKHEDVGQAPSYEVLFIPDREGALLSAGRFSPRSETLHHMLVLRRDDQGNAVDIIEADLATWEPGTEDGTKGRWALQRGREVSQVTIDGGLGPRGQRIERYPEYYESNLSPRDIAIRQAEGWVRYLSLGQLRELQDERVGDLVTVVQTRHQRVTAPVVSLVLLLLGLPFFLDRSPATVISDASKCLGACGLCYVVTFCTQYLKPDSLSALPAWVPIFVFTTWAVTLIDRIRT